MLSRHHLALVFSFAVSAHADVGFQFKVTENAHTDVLRESNVIARFMTAHDISTPERHSDTYKPYLHVFDPSGTVQITKGPGGQFTHHRGVFLGWNKISYEGKTYDRWHMKNGDQIVRSLTSTPGEAAQLTEQIEWQGEGDVPVILNEERRTTFTTPAKPFYLAIDLRTSLKTLKGEAKLDGDPEHAGAQFRPSEKIDPSKTTYLFPGTNIDAHKAKDIPWVAEIFTVEGKTFTALALNHPTNPKDTATSAYRDYGRFGFFAKGSATAEAPFTLHYKWLIAEGEVRDAATLQQAYNTFAEKSEPTPELTIKAAEGKAAPKPKAKATPEAKTK